MEAAACKQAISTRSRLDDLVRRRTREILAAPPDRQVELIRSAGLELLELRVESFRSLPAGACGGTRCLAPAFARAGDVFADLTPNIPIRIASES